MTASGEQQRGGLNPVGVIMAAGFLAAILWATLPILFRSGQTGVIVHGLAFLLTGALVVGGILYASTLGD